MTLDSALAEFESLFKSSRDGAVDTALAVIWSGGQRRPDETAPALYATRDLALSAWLETARAHAGDTWSEEPKGYPSSRESVLEWILKPELVQYQITIADMKQQHRVVSDRYAVKSQFRVVEK